MKLAVFSESEADEAAVRILVDGLLGRETTRPAMPPRRSRGVDSVFATLPVVIKHLHYQTDCDALAVVVDSNSKPVLIEGGTPDDWHPDSRLQRLSDVVRRALDELKPTSHRDQGAALKVAYGLAVPAVEAWYRLAESSEVSEAAWIAGQAEDQWPYTTRQLKHRVYGVEDPPFQREQETAERAARRLVEQGLGALIAAFPTGFGTLARQDRGWELVDG